MAPYIMTTDSVFGRDGLAQGDSARLSGLDPTWTSDTLIRRVLRTLAHFLRPRAVALQGPTPIIRDFQDSHEPSRCAM